MLPFQREDNSADLPGQQPDAAGQVPGENADHSQDQEYLTVAEHGKRTRRSTTVVAVLFVIGLVVLWFMVKKSAPQAASAADVQAEGAKIEAAISRLTGVKSDVFGRMDEIVDKFYEFSDVLQVGVGELTKNPFQASLGEHEKVEMVSDLDMETIWKQQIRYRGESMELRGIMQTDRGNCCMIGSDIYYEGDAVNGFKIREIGDNLVKLQWQTRGNDSSSAAQADGVEIILKLSE